MARGRGRAGAGTPAPHGGGPTRRASRRHLARAGRAPLGARGMGARRDHARGRTLGRACRPARGERGRSRGVAPGPRRADAQPARAGPHDPRGAGGQAGVGAPERAAQSPADPYGPRRDRAARDPPRGAGVRTPGPDAGGAAPAHRAGAAAPSRTPPRGRARPRAGDHRTGWPGADGAAARDPWTGLRVSPPGAGRAPARAHRRGGRRSRHPGQLPRLRRRPARDPAGARGRLRAPDGDAPGGAHARAGRRHPSRAGAGWRRSDGASRSAR